MLTSQPTSELVRGLKLQDAVSLVVGTVIGTGVFLKTAPMLQALGSPYWVILAWFLAGLLSIAGAFTYAELGSLFPNTGGEFVYLREAYGNTPSFLYGWTRFGIASPASIAAYATGAATFLADALSVGDSQFQIAFSVGVIVIFTLLNMAQVQVGGRVQSFLTLLKVILTLGLGVLLFIFTEDGTFTRLTHSLPRSSEKSFISAFGLAMISALWAYDGWNNLPMAAGEVVHAQKNVPKALIFGMSLVFLIYLIVNLSYFYVLPLEQIAQASSQAFPRAPSVGAMAASHAFGPSVMGVLSIGFVVSALGAMNGSILTGARVPYAMAKEGLFFKRFSKVGNKSHVPTFSVLVQGVIAAILAAFGNFDQLTDMVVFTSWIFYAACAGTVFVFRKKMANVVRSYRVVGYPTIPALFILAAMALLVNTLWTMPVESGYGCLYLGMGLVLYKLRLSRR
jgi:APA family basic amino acid/polyamine antiporter